MSNFDDMGKTCSKHGQKRNAYSVLEWKSAERQLGRYRPTWWNNIKMNLRTRRWDVNDSLLWIRFDPMAEFQSALGNP